MTLTDDVKDGARDVSHLAERERRIERSKNIRRDQVKYRHPTRRAKCPARRIQFALILRLFHRCLTVLKCRIDKIETREFEFAIDWGERCRGIRVGREMMELN